MKFGGGSGIKINFMSLALHELLLFTTFTRGGSTRERRMHLRATLSRMKSGIASAIEVNFMAFGLY